MIGKKIIYTVNDMLYSLGIAFKKSSLIYCFSLVPQHKADEVFETHIARSAVFVTLLGNNLPPWKCEELQSKCFDTYLILIF